LLAALALLVNIEWTETGGPKALAMDEASAASRLLARGDASGAEARARKAVALDGENAELRSHLGSALYGQGRFQEAAEAFARAASLAPHNPADCYNAAVCLRALGRARDARHLLQEALRRDPGYSRAREALTPEPR
jgi:adenylate cyclase